jgi:hypothetical protein
MRFHHCITPLIVLICVVSCASLAPSSNKQIDISVQEDSTIEEETASCADNDNNRGVTATMSSTSTSSAVVVVSDKYTQDGAEAQAIAQYLPYFPFKGIPRFYDIGGFLYQPDVFQNIVDIFADRYRAIGIDIVAGYVHVLLIVMFEK